MCLRAGRLDENLEKHSYLYSKEHKKPYCREREKPQRVQVPPLFAIVLQNKEMQNYEVESTWVFILCGEDFALCPPPQKKNDVYLWHHPSLVRRAFHHTP